MKAKNSQTGASWRHSKLLLFQVQRDDYKGLKLSGNGASCDIRQCNWYGWAQEQLSEAGLETVLENMPDPGE